MKRKPAHAEENLGHLIEGPVLKMKMKELRMAERYGQREEDVKVSIILPTWNRGKVIGRAIESVLSQSYKNYELLICDDGSTDNTKEVFMSRYADNSRVRFLSGKHAGVSQARNRGLEHSGGSLIAYLDSDNAWTKNYLLIMVHYLKEHANKSSIYCGIRITDKIRNLKYIRMQDYDRRALLIRNFIDINVFMHERKLFEKHGGFHPDLAPLEDWELIIRYTQQDAPLILDCCLADYYIQDDIDHISLTRWDDKKYWKIRDMYGDSGGVRKELCESLGRRLVI